MLGEDYMEIPPEGESPRCCVKGCTRDADVYYPVYDPEDDFHLRIAMIAFLCNECWNDLEYGGKEIIVRDDTTGTQYALKFGGEDDTIH